MPSAPLSRTCLGFLALIIAIGWPTASFAGDQASDDAMLAINGWKDWASRLVSGRYRATGRVEYRSSKVDLSGDVKMFCAFDYPNGRYRFDRRQPYQAIAIPESDENKVQGADATPKNVIRQLRYSRTNDKTMHWSAGDRIDQDFVISIGPPDRVPLAEIQPLDVRIIGMTAFTEFKNGQPELGGKMVDLVEEFLKKNKVEKAIRHPGALVEILWTLHFDDRTRMTVWFDESKGFVPVRTEFWNRYLDSKEFDTLLSRQEVEWKEKNGVVLPESCIAEEKWGRGEYHRYSLRFDWESVNEAIPESIFDVKADIPEEQTYVFDSRLEKPILVSAPMLNNAPQEHTGPAQTPWGKTLFLTVLTTSAAVCLFLYYRSRKRRLQ